MLLTARPIDAGRAAAVGLVNRVVEDGTARDTAVEVAAGIAANGPLAGAATKRILQEAPSWSPAETWARQEEIVRPVSASDDAREGWAAFAGRRSPVRRGR